MARLRAQAAMELMMNYGWAILVIVIVLAALFYIGVLNPKGASGNAYASPPGFSFYGAKVLNGSGRLDLDFGQAIGKSIVVTSASCSQNVSATPQSLTNSVTVPPGEHRWTVGGDSGNIAYCTDASGSNLTGTAAQSGERYKGTVCVAYTEAGTGTTHTVCGDMTARLEPGVNVSGGGCSPNCNTGSGCSSASQCSTGYCTNGTCQVCTSSCPDGAVCTNNTQCQSGFCGSGRCVQACPSGGGAILACPCTISTVGSYTLGSNLGPYASTCITVTAAGGGSTLDCGGKSITGTGVSSTYGVYLNAANGVTVKNCVISTFNNGINSASSSNSVITGNTANSNTNNGIAVNGGSGNTVSGNIANSNPNCGIAFASSSSGNHILNNNATGNTNRGILLYPSSSNDITGNILTSNSNAIEMQSNSNNNVLTSNTMSGSTGWDIYCSGSSNNARSLNACSTPNKACNGCAPPGTCTTTVCN